MTPSTTTAAYPVTREDLELFRELATIGCTVMAAHLVAHWEDGVGGSGLERFRDSFNAATEAQSDLYVAVQLLDAIGRPGAPINPHLHRTLDDRTRSLLLVLAVRVQEQSRDDIDGAGSIEGDGEEPAYERAFIDFYRERIRHAERALVALESMTPQEVPA